MLKSPFLFAISVLIALVNWTGIAKAQELDLGLSFELPPAKSQTAVIEAAPSKPHQDILTEPSRIEIAVAEMPTELSYKAPVLPPIESASSSARSEQTKADETIELSFAADAISLEEVADEKNNSPSTRNISKHTSSEHNGESSREISLSFHETTNLLDSPQLVSGRNLSVADFETAVGGDNVDLPGGSAINVGDTLGLDDWIFDNGTHSLVARTVGSAEGTRQSDGRRTQAYYGHVDPGNGVWNLGTFSYQHEADSPEEADEKQLQRLKRQGIELEAQAKQQGITLSLVEKLNGLDLANQAPLAALDRGGYIDRLAQAKRLQMDRDEAILWARTHAYIDPDTRQWNAPGLGNNIKSISRDQDRRMFAISEAIKAYDPRGFEASSLASLAGVTLQANGLDSQRERLSALNNPAIAQQVLSDIEISFSLPPAEVPSGTVAASGVVAVTPDTTESATAVSEAESLSVLPRFDDDDIDNNDIGFDFLPTGKIAEIAAQTHSNASEEIAEDTAPEVAIVGTEPVVSEDEQNVDPSALSVQSPVESLRSAQATSVQNLEPRDVLESRDVVEESSVEETEPLVEAIAPTPKAPEQVEEPASKLQRLLSGILERETEAAPSPAPTDVSNSSKTEASGAEALETAVDAADTEATATAPDTTDAEAEHSKEANPSGGASLWRTEDKVVRTK